jgi:hypothetical protein
VLRRWRLDEQEACESDGESCAHRWFPQFEARGV